jgi:hypothetical protein
MAGNTRMTVYLQPKVYRALTVKSAMTDRSISELVNAAVLEVLREDAIDVEAFDKRSKEPTRSFKQVLKDLRRDGGSSIGCQGHKKTKDSQMKISRQGGVTKLVPPTRRPHRLPSLSTLRRSIKRRGRTLSSVVIRSRIGERA